MNTEQIEHRCLEVIRAACKEHGVKMKLVPGDYDPVERCSTFTIAYVLNPRRAINLFVTRQLAWGGGGMLVAELVGIYFGGPSSTLPWIALCVATAIAINRHIATQPALTQEMWRHIIFCELYRRGFISEPGAEGLTRIYFPPQQ